MDDAQLEELRKLQPSVAESYERMTDALSHLGANQEVTAEVQRLVAAVAPSLANTIKEMTEGIHRSVSLVKQASLAQAVVRALPRPEDLLSAQVAQAVRQASETMSRFAAAGNIAAQAQEFHNEIARIAGMPTEQVAKISEAVRQMQQSSSLLDQARLSRVLLDTARVQALGRKGELTEFLRSIPNLPPDQRPVAGRVGNAARRELEALIDAQEAELDETELAASLAEDRIDVTLPGQPFVSGHQHLISQTIREVQDIFIGLGYRVAEGPEVELDYYNFTALNHPPDHPARSLHDTFFIEPPATWSGPSGSYPVLLRTHTSPVQIRTMETQRPPVYIVCTGKTYRRDSDATHTPMFNQVEGLVVDEGITLGDLKGTLHHFVREFFGPDRAMRVRPHYFPFTEPSIEVDISCELCAGAGCRSCKYSGWLEILGAGMVDPNVYGFVDYDPEQVSGFAFGMGVERMAMLKHSIPDLRLFFDNDVRFLEQF